MQLLNRGTNKPITMNRNDTPGRNIFDLSTAREFFVVSHNEDDSSTSAVLGDSDELINLLAYTIRTCPDPELLAAVFMAAVYGYCIYAGKDLTELAKECQDNCTIFIKPK